MCFDFSFFRTDQLVELSQAIASYFDGKPLSQQAFSLLGKISTSIDEEDLVVFEKIEEKNSSPAGRKSLDDRKDLSVEDIINYLQEEYDVEKTVAEASVGTIYGENVELQDYFDWCLEHQLSEDVIQEGIMKYRTEHLGIVDEDQVDTIMKKPSLDQFTKHAIEQSNNDKSNSLKAKLGTIWDAFLCSMETEETSDFINLEKLGEGLETLYRKKLLPINRKFPAYLTPGSPNLIYTTRENIHELALTLYYHDQKKRLPEIDEVLVVRSCTTAEDVELVCRRAFSDVENNKIYTVLYAEKLSFDVSMKVERMLINSDIRNRKYRLVFICCKDGNQNYSYLSTALDKYKAEVPKISKEQLQNYVYRNLMRAESRMDPTSTRLVQSARAGNGKSLAIIRASERLNFNHHHCTLYDREVNISEIVEWLIDNQQTKSLKNTVYHIDLASEVGPSKNDLLFSLTILGGLEDQQGRVWRCNKKDVYMFESTIAPCKDFTSLLPTTICLGPLESLEIMKEHGADRMESLVKLSDRSNNLHQLCDQRKFASDCMQRPAQYLEKFHRGINLDGFFFNSKEIMEQKPSLEILLDRRSCPVENPTFSELFNFLKFLNFQLQECEKSIFCQLGGTEDWQNLRFKNLVVKFLILMTQDFSTRSLEISDQSSLEPMPTIIERRRWESSHHPYIFFNEDSTITFFGIKIDRNMSLVAPDGTVLQNNIMHQNLYHLLREQNKTDKIPIFIPNNFDSLSDDVKLRTLCRILGVERENLENRNDMNSRMIDPDPSYKLTADNVKKLLATYMRMKAGIPVVIMGETGCGKTRMIKYLCDILRANRDTKNLYLMKVHGGLSKQTINQKVTEALQIARNNYNQHNVKMTVMFFDEANTTSWIHLIKDIVVDRINNGSAIPADSTLQFCICVNPYRKHSTEMIQKLETSGLGYHIQAKQTMDRIGDVPLRQLVYRVHPLPVSLFPFVWDFGQPSEADEKEMVKQMVKNNRQTLDQNSMNMMVETICKSQIFLRKCSFESSFVSLRYQNLLKY